MDDELAIYSSCGTASGYRRHMNNRTETCAGCKRAIADYMLEWRHKNGISKTRRVPDHIIQKHGIEVRP